MENAGEDLPAEKGQGFAGLNDSHRTMPAKQCSS